MEDLAAHCREARILHVIPSVSPARGGPSSAVLTMAEGLVGAGLHVDVLTTDDHGDGRSDQTAALTGLTTGATVHYMARQTRFYTFSWPLTVWLQRNLRRYELVHIHALFSYPSVAAALLARFLRVPYIVRPLGTLNRWGIEHRRPWLKQLSFRLLERPILEHAAAVHFTSQQEMDEASALSATVRGRIIPLGLDLAPFAGRTDLTRFYERFPEVRGRPFVLFLSRLDPKKGLDLLLRAFDAVHSLHPEVLLVIAGEGEPGFVDMLRATLGPLDSTESVVWAGYLGGEEKLAALAAAQLFVLPSYSENFGVAAVEALAAGLPVVLTDHVAVAPEVEAADAGLVVPCDVSALSGAIIRLLDDPALRSHLGQNARQLAQSRFGMASMVEGLMALYCDVVEKREP